MKRFSLVILSLFLLLSCFGCSQQQAFQRFESSYTFLDNGDVYENTGAIVFKDYSEGTSQLICRDENCEHLPYYTDKNPFPTCSAVSHNSFNFTAVIAHKKSLYLFESVSGKINIYKSNLYGENRQLVCSVDGSNISQYIFFDGKTMIFASDLFIEEQYKQVKTIGNVYSVNIKNGEATVLYHSEDAFTLGQLAMSGRELIVWHDMRFFDDLTIMNIGRAQAYSVNIDTGEKTLLFESYPEKPLTILGTFGEYIIYSEDSSTDSFWNISYYKMSLHSGKTEKIHQYHDEIRYGGSSMICVADNMFLFYMDDGVSGGYAVDIETGAKRPILPKNNGFIVGSYKNKYKTILWEDGMKGYFLQDKNDFLNYQDIEP